MLAPVPCGGRIIEIGPSFNPLAPKSEGWNSFSIDHLTRDGLLAKYVGHPGVDLARIEPVDFVWSGGPLSDAVPSEQHGSFDAFVASHVIEHTPDLISFLTAAETLLRPAGVVILAIPDKRYCFDYFQPLTTTGQLLAAHADKRSRHTACQAFDHIAYSVRDGGNIAWGQRPSQGLTFVHGLEHAWRLYHTFEDSSSYLDCHAWRFVPASFELLLLELARLGETDWRVERATPADGCEFYAWLRRGGGAYAASLSVETFNARRMALLKQSLLETLTQVEWLLSGEPELRRGLSEVPARMDCPQPMSLDPGSSLAQFRREIAEARDQAAKLAARLVVAECQCEKAMQRALSLEASTSWRVTSPLRTVGRLVSRVRSELGQR